IQFARYAPLVSGRAGGTVILEVPPALTDLMTSLHGVEQVLKAGGALPPFDVHAPLLSLPRALGTTLATIPAETPYLSADPLRSEAWRRRLDADVPRRSGALRVGLAWA